MSGYRIVFMQATPGTAAQAPQAPQVERTPPTRDQLREQIRQSIQEATRAAGQAGATVTIDGRPVIVGAPLPPDMPGVTIQHSGMEDVIPPQAVDIAYGFFIMLAVIIVGWPLARAMGRRIERRAEGPAALDPALGGPLQRIEQAVEAMSIEVERISESQRFMAKLQNGSAGERSALGGGERR